jgi:hypothetical protein
VRKSLRGEEEKEGVVLAEAGPARERLVEREPGTERPVGLLVAKER